MRSFIVFVLIAGAIGCGGPSSDVGDDDGGDPPADAAPPDTAAAVCGNGEVETGETCDDGNAATEVCAYGETSCTVCDATCQESAGTTSVCGDGTPDANHEACDDGNTDTEACAYGLASCMVCAADCTLVAGATSYCSDGTIDATNGETCEDGNAITDACAYGAASCTVCTSACQDGPGITSFCGDGATDNGNAEQCDDGNTATELCAYGETGCTVCDATCQSIAGTTSYCSDGVTDAANGEACDDSNTTTETCAYGNSVGCTVCDSTCQEASGTISYCGDGATDAAAGETCDDSNPTTEVCAYGEASCTVCDAACHSVAGATSLCGDGIVDAANGEACDDGNGITNDGCEPTCELICGADTTASKAWSSDFGCVLRHDTAATAAVAAATCAAEGGELATILSAEQNTYFYERHLVGQHTWIGLGDATTEDTYVWASGASVVYTNWDTNEPNNGNNNEDCVQLYTSNGRWNDISCAGSLPYFCLIPTCGNGTLDAGEACDEGDRQIEACAYGEASCQVCNATCQLQAGETSFCNDGTVDPAEECDGDVPGCYTCSVAPGWTCTTADTCFVGDGAGVGPGAGLGVTDNGYNGTQASMRCVPLVVDTVAGAAVDSVEVTLGITQTWIGDLVIKLYHPGGTVVTLMSRPGYSETIDDGSGGSGDNANVLASHPITFADGAPTSAENMGGLNTSTDLTVCRDDGQCRFAPAAGITGTGTLASFTGLEAAGTWQLCVGDAAGSDVPTIDSVLLQLGSNDLPHCGDGSVDAGEECDDGVLDGTACDGLCTETTHVQARMLLHCELSSDATETLIGAGCHDLADAGVTSGIVPETAGTFTVFSGPGCTGESVSLPAAPFTFCSLTYPSGAGVNDNVASVYLEP